MMNIERLMRKLMVNLGCRIMDIKDNDKKDICDCTLYAIKNPFETKSLSFYKGNKHFDFDIVYQTNTTYDVNDLKKDGMRIKYTSKAINCRSTNEDNVTTSAFYIVMSNNTLVYNIISSELSELDFNVYECCFYDIISDMYTDTLAILFDKSVNEVLTTDVSEDIVNYFMNHILNSENGSRSWMFTNYRDWLLDISIEKSSKCISANKITSNSFKKVNCISIPDVMTGKFYNVKFVISATDKDRKQIIKFVKNIVNSIKVDLVTALYLSIE